MTKNTRESDVAFIQALAELLRENDLTEIEVKREYDDNDTLRITSYNVCYTKLLRGEQARRIDWIRPFTTVKNTSYDPHNVSIKWFEDGALNVAYNCIDRHLSYNFV